VNDRDATFEEHRSRLFGLAYRMTGSVADAEDVVQDAWLRWHKVDIAVANPGGYLSRTVSNLALDRLTSAQATRETYVGPWLPEPLLTEPDVAEGVEQVESISLAMLVVMETLSPLERAVFVLREVFAFSYAEIAGMLERSESAVRQVGHRARSHVQARRPRFAPPEEVRHVTEEFLAACLGGDVNRMLELLAPDVTAWTDGGGKVQAARRPVHGADNFVRWVVGVLRRYEGRMAGALVDLNGRPGVLLTVSGVPDTAAWLDVRDGLITGVHAVRNPDKLRGVAR
jgi:RNA polymerase sigma-70 factor (ECF subfamily)